MADTHGIVYTPQEIVDFMCAAVEDVLDTEFELKLGDEGKCEVQCVPQGIMALLFDAQSRGKDSILTKTGVGTFIDPRVGRGSPP